MDSLLINPINIAQTILDLGRIAVLYGGSSAEREISLQSGGAAIDALKRMGVDVIAIDTQNNAVAQLQAQPINGAFIALHGVGGEDGAEVFAEAPLLGTVPQALEAALVS